MNHLQLLAAIFIFSFFITLINWKERAKIWAIVFALLIYYCLAEWSDLDSGPSSICVNGVTYYGFSNNVAVAYDTDGKIILCKGSD